MSSSMATTCRRSVTGVGARNRHVAAGDVVMPVRPESDILALNCGSSSLKFGVYRVGASRTEMLLTGEAESIGDQAATFHARDCRNAALPSDATPIANQQDAIIRIAKLLAGCDMLAGAV